MRYEDVPDKCKQCRWLDCMEIRMDGDNQYECMA